MARLEERVQWHLGPPRIRYEEAALDVAAEACSDFEALGHLSRAIQSRRTSAARLSRALAARQRISRREWLTAVLDGRLFHDTTAQRDSDFQRDLEAAASGHRTIRLSYGQVFERPCSTAALVATALRMTATRCGASCVAQDV